MDRTACESSAIKSRGYDAGTKTLELEFKSGQIYQYLKFPPEQWAKFQNTRSVGRFFAAEIAGKYEVKHMESEPREEDKKEGDAPAS